MLDKPIIMNTVKPRKCQLATIGKLLANYWQTIGEPLKNCLQETVQKNLHARSFVLTWVMTTKITQLVSALRCQLLIYW